MPFVINPKLHKSKELKHFTPNGSSMTLDELESLVRVCTPVGWSSPWGLMAGVNGGKRTPAEISVKDSSLCGAVELKGDAE